MRGCLNEETLQRYCDGELTGKRMENAASHLASCLTCATALRELEGEESLVTEALAPEFDWVVPTERLQRRIDAAVAGIRLVRPPARASAFWLRGLLHSLLGLTQQRAFVYAGLVVALALVTFAGVNRWRAVTNDEVASTAPASDPGTPSKSSEDDTPINNPGADVAGVNDHNENLPAKPKVRKFRRANPRVDPQREFARVQLLPGERSYLKTIAALDSTIKSEPRTMRPALQAEYERNLALVDRAIATTRTAAKRNPNDPDAAEFMFAAYQSKVDLLNTIADARVYNRPR